MRRASLLISALICVAPTLAAAQASSTDEISRALGFDNRGRNNLLPSTGGSGRPQSEPVAVPRPQPSAKPRDIIYLSELLTGADQRFAYSHLFERIDTAPTWVRRFNETGEAQQIPVHLVKYKGEQYQLARVCNPRSAAACMTIVFNYNPVATALAYFSQGDQGAWALPPYDINLAEFLEEKINAPSFWD